MGSGRGGDGGKRRVRGLTRVDCERRVACSHPASRANSRAISPGRSARWVRRRAGCGRARFDFAQDRLTHPTDIDLSAGAPDLHPTDEDLSAGAPDQVQPMLWRVCSSRPMDAGVRIARVSKTRPRDAPVELSLHGQDPGCRPWRCHSRL